jgi:hypothetical protein
MLMAALIFVVSLVAFGQFFFFYTRSVLAASRRHVLSEHLREVVGLDPQALTADWFGRMLQLVEVCPGSGEDEMSLRAVRAYFSGLSWIRAWMPKAAHGFLARLGEWIERERQACAYFAAVALDQRMAYSRALLVRH